MSLVRPTHGTGPTRAEHVAAGIGVPQPGVLVERRVFPAAGLVAVPAHLSLEEACTLPLAPLTAWMALNWDRPLYKPREGHGWTVVMQGTGGVSVAALEQARALGLTSIITSSSDEKLARAKDLGAAHTINYRTTPDWASEVLRLTDGKGADVIVETGGPGTMEQSLRAVAEGGNISAVGILTGSSSGGGGDSQTAVGLQLINRNATLKGINIGPRDRMEEMLRLYESKAVRPVVGETFGFESAREAMKFMRNEVNYVYRVNDRAVDRIVIAIFYQVFHYFTVLHHISIPSLDRIDGGCPIARDDSNNAKAGSVSSQTIHDSSDGLYIGQHRKYSNCGPLISDRTHNYSWQLDHLTVDLTYPTEPTTTASSTVTVDLSYPTETTTTTGSTVTVDLSYPTETTPITTQSTVTVDLSYPTETTPTNTGSTITVDLSYPTESSVGSTVTIDLSYSPETTTTGTTVTVDLSYPAEPTSSTGTTVTIDLSYPTETTPTSTGTTVTVDLSYPTESASSTGSTVTVDLSYPTESVSSTGSTVTVDLSYPTESVSSTGTTVTVDLSYPTETASSTPSTVTVDLSYPTETTVASTFTVDLTYPGGSTAASTVTVDISYPTETTAASKITIDLSNPKTVASTITVDLSNPSESASAATVTVDLTYPTETVAKTVASTITVDLSNPTESAAASKITDEPKDETDANGEVAVSCPPGWDHSYEQESMIANGIATTRISQTMLERDGTGQYYHEYYEQRALPDEQSATIASQNRTALETVGPSNSLYGLASILVWASIGVLLVESTEPFWPAHLLAWAAGGAVDVLLFGLTANGASLSNTWDIARLCIHLVRVSVFLVAVVYGCLCIRRNPKGESGTDGESRGLLAGSDTGRVPDIDPGSPTAYGSLPHAEASANEDDDPNSPGDEGDDGDQEIKDMQQRRLEEQGGWLGYVRSFLIFLPYIIPYHHRQTQMWLVVSGLCMLLERALTLMIPRQLGILTESLGEMAGSGRVPWRALAIWCALQFPISSATSTLRSMASTRISQFSYRRLTERAFAHVMSLSMDYHTGKSSGRVVKAIEQGSNLSSVLNSVFGIAPIVIDFLVAVVYLTSAFDTTMGFIIVATAMTHTYFAYKGNGMVMKYERGLNEAARAESETLYDSITNWQTVAYHNRASFELERYSKAIWKNTMAMRKFLDGFEYVGLGEGLIMTLGELAAASVVAMRVANGTTSLGSFVFLVSYWDAVRSPMTSLSWSLRDAASHLIDAEWLYQLLQTKPTVRDKPGAQPLRWRGGRVDFKDVGFSYGPDRPIIKDMTFTAEPGQSIALVGETGGGKSTTLKLLYRFYDVTSGSVMIDGQDVRDVTLDSLRESLGAVPQDPSVFDQTIMENVIYARPGATEADVVEACKAARIHHQIMKFPEGYSTRLGERGVRLSGGELQRLAIARVMLRRPQIVVLDEATSSVDSDTEAAVQAAIRELSKDRTVFTVAHRLSTIVNADVILVVDGGRIIERGTHRELLEWGGKYARLWAMQTVVEDDSRAS
ncbi:heavy metal tolerance protein precursor [Purpureocillium lavendulum]|uniref:Heavy metal tolerance protein n=1 Tax=Purpureocillium lavendulum TaxID=1247861 RepID=A0AB34G090_9HYPO|nr:heavy metal tolerance protein precursor [Purpureocillium lavendulum]